MTDMATPVNDGVIAVRGAFAVLAQQLHDARAQHGDVHIADLRIELVGANRSQVEMTTTLCVPAGEPVHGCPVCEG